MWKTALSIVLLVTPLFGQIESNTVRISASRQIVVPADQAVFGVAVTSPTSVILDQILAALPGTGITSADLTGVQNYDPVTFQWNFSLAVPLTSLTGTIATLSKLQQSIGQNNSGQNNSGLALTFSLNGTQVSPQLQASQPCSNADLIADATAQAQQLVAAAGMRLGPIRRLSGTPSIQPSSGVNANFFSGSFSAFLLEGAPPPVSCSLVVEFQLLP